MTTNERAAWAYLMAVAEPPCRPVSALVADVGAVEAAAAIRSRRVPEGHRGVLRPTEARASSIDISEILSAADAVGARLVTPADDEWPGFALLALDQADTAVRGGSPAALWVRGPRRLDQLAGESIAVVGSRAASDYGAHVAGMLTEQLVERGWAIISGAAYGVDAVAHRSALAADGATMAIMACGIDRDYPAAHSRLLTAIAERGVIISEYTPGTTAGRHRFLARNRLVAAMSAGVLVVEAGARSGATSTAAWARKLGRPLGAVPGPISSATSVGCHEMIADGRADLIADVDALISVVRPDGRGPADHGPPRPTDALTDQQQRVHGAIPGRGGITLEEISVVAGVETDSARAALVMMELGGLVATDGRLWTLA